MEGLAAFCSSGDGPVRSKAGVSAVPAVLLEKQRRRTSTSVMPFGGSSTASSAASSGTSAVLTSAAAAHVQTQLTATAVQLLESSQDSSAADVGARSVHRSRSRSCSRPTAASGASAAGASASADTDASDVEHKADDSGCEADVAALSATAPHGTTSSSSSKAAVSDASTADSAVNGDSMDTAATTAATSVESAAADNVLVTSAGVFEGSGSSDSGQTFPSMSLDAATAAATAAAAAAGAGTTPGVYVDSMYISPPDSLLQTATQTATPPAVSGNTAYNDTAAAATAKELLDAQEPQLPVTLVTPRPSFQLRGAEAVQFSNAVLATHDETGGPAEGRPARRNSATAELGTAARRSSSSTAAAAGPRRSSRAGSAGMLSPGQLAARGYLLKAFSKSTFSERSDADSPVSLAGSSGTAAAAAAASTAALSKEQQQQQAQQQQHPAGAAAPRSSASFSPQQHGAPRRRGSLFASTSPLSAGGAALLLSNKSPPPQCGPGLLHSTRSWRSAEALEGNSGGDAPGSEGGHGAAGSRSRTARKGVASFFLDAAAGAEFAARIEADADAASAAASTAAVFSGSASVSAAVVTASPPITALLPLSLPAIETSSVALLPMSSSPTLRWVLALCGIYS
jgi:trimeric autotransporter adhesin